MASQIFVNLPVKDLDASMKFFSALGYTFNKQFTDHNAACMVISETNYAMLLVEPFFKTFTNKEIVNAHTSTEVLIALSVDSREEVDNMINKVIAAGGIETRPATDHGFMYQRSYSDLDGHIWEIFWMDPNNVMPTE